MQLLHCVSPYILSKGFQVVVKPGIDLFSKHFDHFCNRVPSSPILVIARNQPPSLILTNTGNFFLFRDCSSIFFPVKLFENIPLFCQTIPKSPTFFFSKVLPWKPSPSFLVLHTLYFPISLRLPQELSSSVRSNDFLAFWRLLPQLGLFSSDH